MYRGHAMLPDCVAAVKSLRLLFVIATKCSQDIRDDVIQMWHHADTAPQGEEETIYMRS